MGLYEIDEFLKTKLQSALFVALIDDDKILEANNHFNNYYNHLLKLRVDKSRKKAKEEFLNSVTVTYIEKLLSKSDEYIRQSHWSKAIECFQLVFSLDNKVYSNIKILKPFITCLAKTKQKNLVKDIIDDYIKIIEADFKEYKWVAEIYDLIEDNKNSVKYMEQYLDCMNSDEIDPEEYNLCGIYYNKLYSDDNTFVEYAYKAIEYFEKAHSMNPVNTTYLHNITIICGFVNEYQKSRDAWQKLIAIGKLTDMQKFDYSLLSMKIANFEDWYKYYKYRKASDPAIYPYYSFAEPLWDGKTDISNSTLLLHYEQGYGDSLLTFGYINRLKKYTKNIILITQDALYPLFKNCDSGIQVLSASYVDYKELKFDYYLPIMLIPKALNLTPQNVSVGEGYIKVKPEKVDYYKNNYFNNDKFKIGISFRGNEVGIKNRNVPLKTFSMLSDLNNVELYILNKNISDEELKIFDKNNVINIAKTFHNFEDTAAAMENCDIIVSSDNCILNLAGALGEKTFALYNWVTEWRWFDLSGDNVVWYTSVKPFVNEKMNDWIPTMKKVAEEIKSLQ